MYTITLLSYNKFPSSLNEASSNNINFNLTFSNRKAKNHLKKNPCYHQINTTTVSNYIRRQQYKNSVFKS